MPAYQRYYNASEKELQDQWIQNNLSSEEKTSFLAASEENDLLWNSYVTQGLITPEKIYETVFVPEVNASIQVVIGEKLILSNGVSPSQLQIHPNLAQWVTRLPSDIFYNNIELEA